MVEIARKVADWIGRFGVLLAFFLLLGGSRFPQFEPLWDYAIIGEALILLAAAMTVIIHGFLSGKLGGKKPNTTI